MKKCCLIIIILLLGVFMKKNQRYSLDMLGLALLCSSSIMFGMEEDADRAIVSQRAKEFLEKIKVENESVELHQRQFKSFLEERVSHAQEIKSGNSSSLKKEFKMLDSSWAALFTFNVLDVNPNARVSYYYPQMVEENCSHKLRMRLKCRIGDLAEFEKPYAHMLKKVSEQEYKQRLASISKDEVQSMHLQCSEDFAKAILQENGWSNL